MKERFGGTLRNRQFVLELSDAKKAGLILLSDIVHLSPFAINNKRFYLFQEL